MAVKYLTEIHPATGKIDLSWSEIELVKSCWHEAGHAVIARLTGFSVAWVSIDQKFIDADQVAIENCCTGMGPVCMTISSERMNPIINRRSALNKSEKETVIGYCMHVLAGPRAEYQYCPDEFDASVCSRDYQQVGQILAILEPKKVLRKKLLNCAQRRLRKMESQYWDTICDVAYALYTKKTLVASELDHIIARSCCVKAA